MIRKLRISNFALIESLELELNEGFTILTGETGSGKSILLNAFSLIAGNRSSSTLVGAYGHKAVVEIFLSPFRDDQSFFKGIVVAAFMGFWYTVVSLGRFSTF